MKLLLDTHIFIWLDTAPEKLPPTVLHACQDTGNTLYLSVVSVWEMLIKQKLGKLELDIPIEEMLETHQNANQLQILSITLNHVLTTQSLPLHHSDPFDRMLIAQTRTENACLVTADTQIKQYTDQINLLW